MPGIGISISPFMKRVVGGYNATTTAWIEQVITNGGSVTDAEKSAINTYTNSIDIDEFDRLWVHGLQNEIAAKTSIVNPSSTIITNVNSTTFTAGQGFTGNGTTMYLNTNYNPNVDNSAFLLNSGSIGVYVLNSSTSQDCEIGNWDGTNYNILVPDLSGSFYGGINDGLSTPLGVTVSNAGFNSVSRDGASSLKYVLNGSTIYTSTNVSVAIPSNNIFLLAFNFNGGGPQRLSDNTLALSFIGSGNIDQAAFYTATQTLATTLGFNV